MKEFHGFSHENIVLNENSDYKRLKKTVLLNKIDWSAETTMEIKIVKFVCFYLFQKERTMMSLDKNLIFREKIALGEKCLKVSNTNKIILKQKFNR